MPNSPQAILFVCSMNMVRSPLAAALARHASNNKLFVRSAGIQKGTQDPRVDRVLGELDITSSASEPKCLEDLGDSFFDLVIVLSDEALPYIEKWAADKAMDLEHWPTEDPTKATGNAEQVLSAYRAVRDQLNSKIQARFAAS